MQTNNSTTRRGRGGLIAIIALLVLALLGWGIWAFASRSTTAAGLVDAQQKAHIALTVKRPAVDCVALVRKHFGAESVKSIDGKDVVIFDIGAWQPSDAKISTDAVNVRLTPQTAEAELATVCHDPGQAAMVMNRLGAIKIGDKSIGDDNAAWIKAQGDPSVINDWATSCTTDNLGEHLACQETMAKAATLLTLFDSEGMTQSDSEWNVHLANAAVVGSIPEFELNKNQERNAHFLTFTYTDKVLGCVTRFGFNMGVDEVNGGDQRIAGLPCEVKPKPASTAPAVVKPTPKPSSPPTHKVPLCTSGPNKGQPISSQPNGVCPVGKQASERPPGVTVKTCGTNQYLGRDGVCHEFGSGSGGSSTATSASQTGKGGSGPGATNTTKAPATSSPAATVPVTAPPTVVVPKP